MYTPWINWMYMGFTSDAAWILPRIPHGTYYSDQLVKRETIKNCIIITVYTLLIGIYSPIIFLFKKNTSQVLLCYDVSAFCRGEIIRHEPHWIELESWAGEHGFFCGDCCGQHIVTDICNTLVKSKSSDGKTCQNWVQCFVKQCQVF